MCNSLLYNTEFNKLGFVKICYGGLVLEYNQFLPSFKNNAFFKSGRKRSFRIVNRSLRYTLNLLNDPPTIFIYLWTMLSLSNYDHSLLIRFKSSDRFCRCYGRARITQ